ncbi:MAG: NADH:flavin oxidoreductase [Acidobacteria bacterium]|nr:NADH:flavin oxidoreductase [Acidobacteriota bacterium]
MRHFTYRTLEDLEHSADRLGAAHVRLEADPEQVKAALGRKVALRSFTLGNSLATHPMEGCDATPDGRPDELTWRRYQRLAAGGAKLIWFEATAVCEEGRANPRQVWINRVTADDFARLVDTMLRVHRERWGSADDLLIPVQLTHSGRYSHPRRILAYHHPLLDRKTGTPPDYPVIADDELERLEDQYVEAAGLALSAGFRAFDLKVTHGYLLAELIGAKTREGRYGGPLEDRTRFMRNVLGKIRAKFGARLTPCMRLGCFDSVPYERDPETGVGRPMDYPLPYPWGFGVDPHDPLREDLSEVKQAIAWFREWGIELLNVSAGSPYANPHIGRPFEVPDEGNYEQPEHPLLGVDRHFRIAGELQRAFPDLAMVGTGYSWLQKYAINAGAWNIEQGAIRVMGLGRGVLAYPDYAADALALGELDERRVCKTLTYCTFLMRQKNHPLGQFPTGCPPFDKEVYGPIMKEARAARRTAP